MCRVGTEESAFLVILLLLSSSSKPLVSLLLEMVSDGANVTFGRVKLVSHWVAMSVECERDYVSACFPAYNVCSQLVLMRGDYS